MTTPTYHPGDRVRVRAETALGWKDRKIRARVTKGTSATVLNVHDANMPAPLRRYAVEFDPIAWADTGLVAVLSPRHLEPAL